MLRLSKTSRIVALAAALFVGTAAFAQDGGLSGRLDNADKQLQADTQACKPINIAEYASLLNEASENQKRAAKAAKAGAPVDQTQVNADLVKAASLFSRAQGALVQQCMRAAQGQPPAQPQTPPTPAGTPIPAGAPAQLVVDNGGTGSAIDAAAKKLDEDIKACRPIDVKDYEAVVGEARRHLMAASKVASAGVPIDSDKLLADFRRSEALRDRAKAAAAEQKICPPKREATTEPPPKSPELPPKTTGALIPNAPPLSRFAQEVLAAHNQARQAMNSPPLRWDPVLAEHATARAGELAQIGELVHAPREGRGIERENILEAPLGYTPTQMMGRWASEQQHFVPGIFPNVCNTGGDCSGVWHYTQMIWSTTTDIGCGEAPGHGFNWVVCRYSPGGNKDGKPVIAGGQLAGASSSPDTALSFMVNGLLDFGDDDGVSGFIGGGVGVARVEYNNLVAFSRFTESDSGALLAQQLFGIYCQPGETYCATDVLAPELPKREVFKPKPPEKLEDPM